ncbi:MAG: AAA family ATPase [Xanthobacteraceae bacterium]
MIDDDDDHAFDDDNVFDSDDASNTAALDADLVTAGAAADSADDADERLRGLPRILRYAMLVEDRADAIELRLAAEINQLCPDLSSAMAWATTRDAETSLALAAKLDRLAVTRDLPLLRSLGDCVRLLSLTLPFEVRGFGEFRRVTRALIMTFDAAVGDLQDEQRVALERLICGWAALPMAHGSTNRGPRWPAIHFAARLGDQLAAYRIHSVAADADRRVRHELEQQADAARPTEARISTRTVLASGSVTPSSGTSLPSHHVVVGRMNEVEMRSVKLKDLIVPVREILNVPVPLVETPPLDRIRSALMMEFPYTVPVIDFALADLMGRPFIKMRPLLLVGDPGSGKSRFARRLGELLSLTVWRIDAAQSDGSAFAGTDRRWHSSECCHPLLAIARGQTANPLILIDELEKAATRTDYGRLWDCLLGFIEPETGSRYPDPARQIRLDLSHVNYIATANSLEPLPTALRDRFRIISFPKPTIDDLDALLPGLLRAIAAERGVDVRWITPIDAVERATITKHWPGGSIRRLVRILEAILQARDHRATRQ